METKGKGMVPFQVVRRTLAGQKLAGFCARAFWGMLVTVLWVEYLQWESNMSASHHGNAGVMNMRAEWAVVQQTG